MPPEPPRPDAGHGGSRLADLDLENGELVVYDPDNHDAWIQSDAPVALDEQE